MGNTNPECKCLTLDLMMNGCPSAGGGACPSVVKAPTVAVASPVELNPWASACSDCGEPLAAQRMARGDKLCYYCEPF